MNIQLDLSKTIMNNNPIHLIVCCSGGADSMALLDMGYHYICNQQEQSDKSNITLSVFHVKHGMSANQNDWAELVQKYGSSLGLDVYVANVNQEQNKLTETEARTKRYAALDEYIQILDKQLSKNPQDVKHTKYTQDTKCPQDMEYTKCAKHTQFIVLTGHHKDDRLENFLISIFKNRVHNFDLVNRIGRSESDRRVCFQKPLLGYAKDELINYCQSKNIEYVADESNLISDNLRNIFRNQVFPFIEKLKNPKQYLTSLESFFDSYKVFHDFYILSVQDVKNKMMQQVKKLDDGLRYSCSLDLIRERTGCIGFPSNDNLNCSTYLSDTQGDLKTQDYRNELNIHQSKLDNGLFCDDINQDILEVQNEHGNVRDNKQFYEFIGYLVLLFVNSSAYFDNPNKTKNNRFNQKDLVKKLPVLIKNESRYIVNDKVIVWIKNGNLFIKVKY
jgi:tRNA(ile)-lysidine synthase